MANYKYYNYKDLEITSSIKPYSSHLWWEHATYGLFAVSSGNQALLYYTTDKGDNWTNIDLTGATSKKIQAGWLDGNDLWLVCCDNTDVAGDDEFTVIYIELDNSNNVVDVGDSSGADAATVKAYDIFKIGSDHFVINYEQRSGTDMFVVWDVDSAPFTEKDTHSDASLLIPLMYFGIIDGNIYRTVIVKTAFGSTYSLTYNNSTTTIAIGTGYFSGTIYGRVGAGNKYNFISFDGTDTLYFVMAAPLNVTLISYSITGDSFTELQEMDIVLMLDRNVFGSTPPFTLEKGYNVSADKIYQIPPTYIGRLNYISNYDFTSAIIGISDHYIIDNGGKMYEFVDMVAEHAIFRGEMYHIRQDYSYMKLKFNSDLLTIVPQMFIQIIGKHTRSGSTSSDVVVFEGIAQKPVEGRVQIVLVVNQASEMDEVKAQGSKSGRTDQIISDIHDDGAPNGPSYIHDGILSAGTAMGDQEVDGKKLRTLYDDYAENDGFSWALRPQGEFDYDDGTVDSGADIRYDGSTYTDTIRHLTTWKVAKKNQIIVNGAINPSTGKLYTGQWDDTDDQQVNGVNSMTIEDASLNSDALCQSKADTLGANEAEIQRAEFKFRKTTYGLIQPNQTITFKFDVTNYITIAEAQFVVDLIMINIISEMGYMAISSSI